MSRHRAIAESRLEGRTAPNVDPSLPLDPTLIDESLVEAFPPRSRLQQQQQASVIRQVSPTRSAYPAAREEQRLPKTASQILRERFEGKDPFARSVDQLMDRGRERPVELSQWSATTVSLVSRCEHGTCGNEELTRVGIGRLEIRFVRRRVV